MRRLLACLACLPLVLLFAACGSSTVTLDGFDTSCTADKDCIAVYVGDVCATPACNCDNEVINVVSLVSYQAELEAATDSCVGTPSGPECDCPSLSPRCVKQTCVIH